MQIKEPLPTPASLIQPATPAVSQPHPMKRKLSANTVNLIIVLIISLLLLFDYALGPISQNWEQLRVFTHNPTSVFLLAKLLPLRIAIAFVFLWYGIDNFEHPEIFNNLANTCLKKMHLEKPTQKFNFNPFGYIQSIAEIFVGVSLVTGIALDLGALLGSLLLVAVLFAYEEGLHSLLVRDVGLLGGTISLFLLSIMGKMPL